MADDFRSFDLALKRFAADTVPGDVRDLRDAVSLEVVKGVVLMTRVDTSRARSNWQTTVGTPAEGFDADSRDESGGAAIAKAEAALSAASDPYEEIWVHNGVPYIRHLNDILGDHMVERTVARIRKMFS